MTLSKFGQIVRSVLSRYDPNTNLVLILLSILVPESCEQTLEKAADLDSSLSRPLTKVCAVPLYIVPNLLFASDCGYARHEWTDAWVEASCCSFTRT